MWVAEQAKDRQMGLKYSCQVKYNIDVAQWVSVSQSGVFARSKRYFDAADGRRNNAEGPDWRDDDREDGAGMDIYDALLGKRTRGGG